MRVTVQTLVHIGDEDSIIAQHNASCGGTVEELATTIENLAERGKREAVGALHLDWENPD